MKYRRKPEIVEAVQWFPGINLDYVITKSSELAGKHWAHLGHARELDGFTGIVERSAGGDPHFVGSGDWIVTFENGKRGVFTKSLFESTFEKVEP